MMLQFHGCLLRYWQGDNGGYCVCMHYRHIQTVISVWNLKFTSVWIKRQATGSAESQMKEAAVSVTGGLVNCLSMHSQVISSTLWMRYNENISLIIRTSSENILCFLLVNYFHVKRLFSKLF